MDRPRPGYICGQRDARRLAPQINDVFVDDRGIVYACDRFTGGLYILTSDVLPR